MSLKSYIRFKIDGNCFVAKKHCWVVFLFNPKNIHFIRNSSWVFYIYFPFLFFLPFTFAIQWNFRAYVDCITTELTFFVNFKNNVYKCSFCFYFNFFFSLTNFIVYTVDFCCDFAIHSVQYIHWYMFVCVFCMSVCLFVWFCICVQISTCVDEITRLKDKRNCNVLCVCLTLHRVISKPYWFWDTFGEL